MDTFYGYLREHPFHAAPLILIAMFAVAITCERLRALFWVYPLQDMTGFFEQIRDLVMSDRIGEAIAFCDKYKGKPAANIVREGLLRANQPETLIEDGLELAVGEATSRVQKRTQFLSMIANVSTLLGLFGTIFGLIDSFNAVGGDQVHGQDKAKLLASGISTAMHSTMLGLGIAIPCIMAFSYLMNRTNRLNAELDHSAVKILDLIKQRYYAAEIEVSDEGPKSTSPRVA
jgi:biopolymer transport protein ExbB/TolQ